MVGWTHGRLAGATLGIGALGAGLLGKENSMTTNPDHDLKVLKDTIEITHTLYRGLRCTDEKNWEERVTFFADELTIDFGGVKPSQRIKAADLAAWAKRAYALVTTQHMMFNVDIVVDGNKATSTSNGHARHQRMDTDDFWNIYPRYEHEYVRQADGWKISRIKMTPIFEEGNPRLLDESFAASQP
jgi:SnoaL-like domain